ncbi:helix-turn-helix domain-containing protein [Streptomyces sp. GSL17-111]|uniref:helix-turn-helix domain-containing protein n=1 Tax=Streptomyces sp. GSL17-111 TaxID=3121596 RepID=UPI0030F39D26
MSEEPTEDGTQADHEPSAGILSVFGRQLKRLRLRARMERSELGAATGYSVSTIASYEQGRRIPPPTFIDKADDVLDAGGVLLEMKEEVKRAKYPPFFRDAAKLEANATEIHVYATQAVPGLLQTDEYALAVIGMMRPPLADDVVEQRASARIERQEVFAGKPQPLFGFVVDEAVIRRPLGGRTVWRRQLEHLLRVAQRRTVEVQVMPLDVEDHAGLDGPFTVIHRPDGDQVAYLEAQARSTLVTDRAEVQGIVARYGIIRAQALTPRESMTFIAQLLGEH